MKQQTGSAIVMILIAIALFAALSYAFSSSNRASLSIMSDEKAALRANEIIAYGNDIKVAIQRLKLKGCGEDEISFENDVSTSDYTNPNAPSNKTCHVFEHEGGGLKFKIFSEDTFVTAPYSDRQPQFKGGIQIDGVGTSASDLHMQVHDLKQEVCLKINDLLSVTNPSNQPPEDGNGPNGIFKGTYSAPDADGIGDDPGSNLSGEKSFCRDSDSGASTFYQYITVLLAR